MDCFPRRASMGSASTTEWKLVRRTSNRRKQTTHLEGEAHAPRSARNKSMIVGVILLSIGVLIKSANVPWKVEDAEKRTLSINLGGGKCLWTKAVAQGKDADLFGTVLASYPASGMRLAWQHVEALTGIQVGDDYGFVLPQAAERTGIIKTQYPHLEGIWSWEDKMDQVVLVVRSPRWALPSYHSLLYEIEYAPDYEHAVLHYFNVFTKRPPVATWIKWRDFKFSTEIETWGFVIDYWMEGGLQYWDDYDFERNGERPFKWLDASQRKIDMHCINDMDCYPKTVVSYEALNDHVRGPAEANKLAKVFENKFGVNVIEEEARECVWNKTMGYNPFMAPNNDNRESVAQVKRDDYTFTYAQMLVIKDKLVEMKNKYGLDKWVNNPLAKDLVQFFTEYLDDLNKEIIKMEANPPPTMAPNPDYQQQLFDWYTVISRGNRYPEGKIEAMEGIWPNVNLYDENGHLID